MGSSLHTVIFRLNVRGKCSMTDQEMLRSDVVAEAIRSCGVARPGVGF